MVSLTLLAEDTKKSTVSKFNSTAPKLDIASTKKKAFGWCFLKNVHYKYYKYDVPNILH